MTGIDHSKYKLSRMKGAQTRVYPPGSFFPLIQQDALAVMTLRSYSANCLQVLEWGVLPFTGQPLPRDVRIHLEDLGQDALSLADQWALGDLHLPD